MTFTKKALGVAVAAALGSVAMGAQAAAVLGIQVKDVGKTLAGGAYSPLLDGKSGAFRFSPINLQTYVGASLWTGDVGTGTILGQGLPNPPLSFSTGFIFAGSPFQPDTYGANMNADITAGVLTFPTMDFGGFYTGAAFQFNLPPDPGTMKVNWLVQTSPTTYDTQFQWSHYITAVDDPSLTYVGFTAYWVVEGTATVVPLPAGAWLLGMGAAGLLGIARPRRRKA